MLEGLPPNDAAHVMRLRTDEATARLVADIITESFEPAETAAAAFETDPSTADWRSGDWTLEVFFGPEPDEPLIRSLVEAMAGETVAQALVFSRIAQQDWISASLEGLAPVRAGRFLVHGAHARDAVRVNDIGLEIEAALAFGTGHHGTTRGCLLALAQVLKQRRPYKVLDIGTGTGVLAIAAARMLKGPIAAGDIDPVATSTARRNARANGVGPWVHPVTARGLSHPVLAGQRDYDLVLANILARPLRMLARDVARAATSDATLILSGLLAPDVAGVLSAYAAQGFALERKRMIEGWATLVLRRGGAAPRPVEDDDD
jgi:ribosomal protein L11 methyltransferase